MASTLLNQLAAKPVPSIRKDVAVKLPKPERPRIQNLEDIKPQKTREQLDEGEEVDEEGRPIQEESSQTIQEFAEESAVKGITVKDMRESFDASKRDQILEKIRGKQQIVLKVPKKRSTAKFDSAIAPIEPIGEGEDEESRVQTVLDAIPEKKPTTITVRTKKGKTTKKKKKLKLSQTISKGTITGSVADLSQERLIKKPEEGIIMEVPKSKLVIGDTILEDRLPPEEEKVIIKSDAYYMNNREIFSNFINKLFQPYRDQIQDESAETLSCASIRERKKTGQFTLLTHQNIVRDYLNLYTPYRGLLLFHGLGSGKTCTSIAIAEGLKTTNQVIIMTPASLRANYIKEMKFCGDSIYKKNQYWEFVDTVANPELLQPLTDALSLEEAYIRKNGGAWLVNIKKESNFESLPTAQRQEIDAQINEMISSKYRFINYNGLRNSHLETLTSGFTQNPFDNKVIIIDEAHNFISRIVNKLGRDETMSMRLYEYLLSAENVRIILLTGTPIINYPNEIGILYNILRGYIKTWRLQLNVKSKRIETKEKGKTERKVNTETIRKIFERFNILDYFEYKPSSKILTITRNPFGFVSKLRKDKGTSDIVNKGVQFKEGEFVSDAEFIKRVFQILAKEDIDVMSGSDDVQFNKALPDDLEGFKNLFIEGESGNIKNINMFKRRIIGLTSYFKSAQEKLMPRYIEDRDLQIVKIPMSDYQFGVYEEARADERKQETNNAKRRKKGGDKLYDSTTSTYRIFSRAFCNFAFPKPPGRPFPKEGEEVKEVLDGNVDEDIIDAVPIQEKLDNPDGRHTADDATVLEELEKAELDSSYEQRIQNAIQFLRDNPEQTIMPEALQKYSPKFLAILENVKDVDMNGIHLIYSQFRTIEGIGILKVILEANGFAQFKIRKDASDQWIIDMTDEEMKKPKFALYTGTETPEEKDIILNVSNSTWENVPSTITDKLLEHHTNNFLGEIIKVFMITSSGAEGIDMRNVRYVHIVEPYWHPVRTQQVIGRARRICSHEDLPEELRTVNVFFYLMTFTEEQLSSDASIELRLKDKSKIDKKTPLTSDESLFEISNIKQDINRQILKAVKETAMDCSLHSSSKDDGESLVCFSISSTKPNKFAYSPSLSNEESDTVTKINREVVKWKAKKITMDGKSFAFRKETNEVYDLDSYMQARKIPGVNPIKIGVLEISKGKARINRAGV